MTRSSGAGRELGAAATTTKIGDVAITNPTPHQRRNAPRDLARDLANTVEKRHTQLLWIVDGLWTVDHQTAKFDLQGPDGMTARVTVVVSGTEDPDL